MGDVIGVSPWLVTLSRKGMPYAPVAQKVMRTQLLTPRRGGHSLELDTEYIRRRVCHAARWGHIADVMVTCTRCGVQAKLANWFDAALLDDHGRQAILEDKRVHLPVEILAYLRPCPGEVYRAAIAESPGLPKMEGQ